MLPHSQKFRASLFALLAALGATTGFALTIDFQPGYVSGQTLNGQPAGAVSTWARFTGNSAGDSSLLIDHADLPAGRFAQAVNAGAPGGFRLPVSSEDLVPGGSYTFDATQSLLRFGFTIRFDSVNPVANANAIGLVRIGDPTASTVHLELIADGRLRYSTYDAGTAAIQQVYAQNASGGIFHATAGTSVRVSGTVDYAANTLTLVIGSVPQSAFGQNGSRSIAFRNPSATDNDWIVNTLNVGAAYFQTWSLDDLQLTGRAHAHVAANPAGSGWVDVTQPPYSADPTGATDSTAALQQAISDHIRVKDGMRTLYFPNGTYTVTSPLQWRDGTGLNAAYLTLQGESRDGVILRVPDSHAAWQAPDANGVYPAVIYVRSDHNPNWYATQPEGDLLGEGHLAFHNNLVNFTIDVGAGNPGAVGIDYHASNQGILRDVRIVAGSGSGKVGLRIDRDNVGPGLVKQLRIEGFETGIWARSQYGVTLEHIDLVGQSLAGLINETAVLAVRGLRSTNTVPAVTCTAVDGLLALLDAELFGGDPLNHAIELNDGRLFARNVLSEGYASALTLAATPVAGDYLAQYSSSGVATLLPSRSLALALPVEETPAYEDGNMADWAFVTTYGASPDDDVDDTAAIQAALDSGKGTVFFPSPAGAGGSYRVSASLDVPATVRRIHGNWADLRAVAGGAFAARDHTQPLILVADDASTPLVIERLTLRGIGFDLYAPGVLQTSRRDLALKHLVLPSFRNGPGAGRLFLEDVTNHEDGETYHFEYPQQVWARSLNPEAYQHTKVLNNGGQLWILGYKQERPSTALKTVGGGLTELYGAILYQNHELPDDVPVFRSTDSSQSLVFATHAQPGNRLYRTLAVETRGATSATLLSADADPRGGVANSTAYSLLNAYPSAYWNPADKPRVRILPPGHGVDEGGSGAFTLVRTGGDLSQALTVDFSVTGTATAGLDYVSLGTSVGFPAHADSVTLPVTTHSGGGDEPTETVVVSLSPSANYLLGHPASAALNVWDPVAATKSGPLPGTGRVLWLRADGRVLRDADDRVLFWNDESGEANHAYNRESDRAPQWVASSISGQPALRFTERQLFLPKTASFQNGGPYTERSLLVAFQTGSDVTSRQSIYEEGGNGRGFALYLKDGLLHGGAWSVATWGSKFISRAVEPNTRYFVELYFKTATDSFEMFLNGGFVDLLNGIGEMDARGDQSTLGGAFSSALYADLNEPRKLGGYYFKGRLHELTVHNATLNAKLRDKARKYFLPKYVTGPASQSAPQISFLSPSPTPKFLDASAGLSLSLDATVTSSPGTTVSTQWVQLSGQPIVFADSTDRQTTATFPGAGVYRFKLVADDGDLANEAACTVIFQ